MSLRVSMPRAQRRRLEKVWRKTPSRIEALRCRILLLLSQGRSATEVAGMAGCVRATVYRTVYRFAELGEDAVRDQRTARAADKVTAEMTTTLLGYLDGVPRDYGWQRCTWTLELLVLQLAEDFKVTLSTSTVYRTLCTQGCRRGRPRPGLQIPVRGRRQILRRIAARVAAASPSEEVFYQDEADLHLNPKIGSTYLRRGQQAVVLTPGKNVKRYIFGALNARTGRIVSGIVEYKTAAMFVEFLQYLSSVYRGAKRLHLVLDNYVIHKAQIVKNYLASRAGRIELHFLPPYSPNDNRIERLWKQMHDHVTRNHRHQHIEPLVEDVRRFLRETQPFPGTKVSTRRA